MVKSFLVRESLSFLRGYGAGRRGQGNERDAAARHLRGRCAANVPHRPAFAKARRFSRRPARRPRRGLESLGRVRPRPPQFTPNQIALRLQRTLNGCGMVVSKSLLDSTRRMVVIGSRLARGCVAVGGVYIGVVEWLNRRRGFRMRAYVRGRREGIKKRQSATRIVVYTTIAPFFAVTLISAPGRYFPAMMFFAIGFSSSRWIARFTGLAPNAGS